MPNAPLPWYAEQKLEKGAFAAVVGLELEDDMVGQPGDCRWRAWAVGDSCLAVVRHRGLDHDSGHNRSVIFFPVECSDDFGTSPALLSTNPKASVDAVSERKEGKAGVSDRFYLMTDALAQWFLSEHERAREPWFELDSFVDDREAPPFREWVRDLRQTGRMRNDDVTLLLVEIEQ